MTYFVHTSCRLVSKQNPRAPSPLPQKSWLWSLWRFLARNAWMVPPSGYNNKHPQSKPASRVCSAASGSSSGKELRYGRVADVPVILLKRREGFDVCCRGPGCPPAGGSREGLAPNKRRKKAIRPAAPMSSV